MRRALLVPLVAAAVLGVVASAFVFGVEPTPAAASLPPGFQDRLVTSVQQPTALAFLPDGRMLITAKDGQLRVRRSGTATTTTALDISGRICANSERGLLGVAVDPNFEVNGHVYLYYTARVGSNCDTGTSDPGDRDTNRVSRFDMDGNTVAASSEKILIGAIPSTGGNHNAGDLHFGKDGYLYASVGDGGTDYEGDPGRGGSNDAARDKNVLLGKILRVTRDGGVPPDNPFTGPDSARCYDPAPGGNKEGRVAAGKVCKEAFATGLRNPFRMAFDPDSAGTRLFINDVGQNAWEEVDKGIKGADYGWNVCEGRHDNPDREGEPGCAPGDYTPPVHEYNHNTGCSSITGGAFVPDAAPWPSSYDEAYLFGDYVCGKIFKLVPAESGGYSKSVLAEDLGRGGPTAMIFGPSGASRVLYYASFAEGGQIRRISYASGNAAPEAAVEATPPYAESERDLTIDFDGSASRDADGDKLTYAWDFDYDGETFEADGRATGQTESYSYPDPGKRTAALRVTDAGGLSDIATVKVYPGDMPPRPVIESPTGGTRFRVGQRLTAEGSVTDAENGADLKWEVIRHHNNSHTHPYESGTGGSLTFTAPEPEDLYATNPQGNYLELRLTATEPDGPSASVSRRLEPRTTSVTLASNPSGLRLVANGRTFAAPRTFLSWEGDSVTVKAPDQSRNGRSYVFRSWSDNRARQHAIAVPAEYKRYTANFKRR